MAELSASPKPPLVSLAELSIHYQLECYLSNSKPSIPLKCCNSSWLLSQSLLRHLAAVQQNTDEIYKLFFVRQGFTN